MNKKKAFAIGGAAAVSLLMAVPAFAATTDTTTASTTSSHVAGKHAHKFSGVMGTVSAINGTTLTVTNKKGTAYTVDVSDATFQKGFGKTETAITLSNVAVNDVVAVQGTVNGTSVTATKVVDGLSATQTEGAMHKKLTNASMGTIASINGSTLTLTHKTKTGTTSTTVTTTSATTYKKNGVADTASDLAVGQRVVVMGVKDTSGNVSDATSVNIMVRKARTASTTSST